MAYGSSGRELLFRPPKHKPPIGALCRSPVLICFDPGSTTGYSVMQVHPEALCEPDVKILENIQFHGHGQIDCGARKGNAGDSPARSAVEIYSEDVVRRRPGSGIEEHMEVISGGDPLGISITGESAGVSEMMSLVDSWPGAATLLEDFILRTKIMDRDVLSAVRVTAAAEFCLWMMGRIEAPRQSPSLAKTTVTDDRLKDWGFYRREGGMKHARDADRHAITFFRRCKMGVDGQALREQAWPHLFGIVTRDGEDVKGPYWKPMPRTKSKKP